MKGHIDFTSGNIAKSLILFAIPITIGELLQNLYSSVDAFIVGNFVSKAALAAVSNSDPLVNLLIGFFNGISIGSSVVVARWFGSGQRERLFSSIRVCFSVASAGGALLSVVGIIAAPILIQASNTIPDVYNDAVIYLRIYLAGILFTVIYNVAAGVLRAVGNSRTPMRILLITCFVNIFLDILFVAQFHMGIAGAGIATVISQALSVFLAYRELRLLCGNLHASAEELQQCRQDIYDLFKIGLPAAIQHSLTAVSNLFVWRYINRFNSVSVAAGIGIAQKLDRFVVLPCKSLGLATTTFVSQNVGAKQLERSKKGLPYTLLISAVVSAALGGLIYFFAPVCSSLFSKDSSTITVSIAMIRTIVPFYVFLAAREILLGALRGYGNAKIPVVLALSAMLGVRQLYLALSALLRTDVRDIFYCYPVAYIASVVFIGSYYLIVKKSLYKDP